MTETYTEYDTRLVEKALTILFGRDSEWAAKDRLDRIDGDVLKSAFRRKSLHFHPDRAASLGMDEATLCELFKRLHGAYRFLNKVVIDEQRKTQDPASNDLWTPGSESKRQSGDVYTGQPNTTGVHRRTTRSSSGLYTGPPPRSYVRFAQFLYYHRIIDWQTMIDAITWQRRVRPKIGEIGRSYRFFDHHDIIRILRNAGPGNLFGATALNLNIIDQRQLLTMVGKQRNMRLPIGRYFIDKRILTPAEVDNLLEQKRRHNMRYGNRRTGERGS